MARADLGGKNVADEQWHEAIVVVKKGVAGVYLDGELIAEEDDFARPDKPEFVFKVGNAAPDFGGKLEEAEIGGLRFWNRAIEGAEFEALAKGKVDEVNTPDFTWGGHQQGVETFGGMGTAGVPVPLQLEVEDDFTVKEAWVQPLEPVDHARHISRWSEESFHAGREIYQSLCVTCHGTREQEGSIPTAIKFHEGEFKNGSDPYRIYQTLDKGYGMMIAQPQYTPEQKYAVIHYLREEFLKEDNPEQFFEVTDAYLEALPRELETMEKQVVQAVDEGKPYEEMDFGQALMWTYQVGEDNNIAQKGINVRLDGHEGGISKGSAWMVYEADTMRVAAAYTGDFVDWRGIAFDGSHGSHTSIAGEPLFVTSDAPAWQNPTTGKWEDDRVEGRDGRRYGPTSEGWIRYRGLFYHENEVPVIHYQIGDAEILEQAGFVSYGEASIFTRTLNVGKSPHDLIANLAPDSDELTVILGGDTGATLQRDGVNVQLTVPASATPMNVMIGFTKGTEAEVAGLLGDPVDLDPLTRGGAPRFGAQEVVVQGALGDDSSAFAVDTIPVPNRGENPWKSWMRLGGFDFFADNPDRAAVCTWLGDVWIVDGVAGDLSKVKWRRICSGLFQPLGLKIVDEQIYVTCRDQIARLHDFNGDDEIDYVECFNHHAQVTEHFHEFAMGLQTDDEGNFYYAKSARHAKVAVVPHHGTLLRVSPDGKRTDIVATGFRAANGVCVNPDGTWIVTDQEGHWNPKNRINYVREGGFYGNMFGYHDVTDESDSAMEQPLCWITNAFDRSPAELVWVPENAQWGSLNGTLLNLSYGYGQIYTVPHEVLPNGQAQGGMSPLLPENLATGIHRGRFHPDNGQLYAVGMFAWAGSQKADGGFYRIRATGKAAYQPIKTEVSEGAYTITFSDKLPKSGEFSVTVWDLERTKRYGSDHLNERELEIKSATIASNTVILELPDLAPTWGMEVRCVFEGEIERIIHASVHELNPVE